MTMAATINALGNDTLPCLCFHEKYTKTRFFKISLLKRKSIRLGEESEKKKKLVQLMAPSPTQAVKN